MTNENKENETKTVLADVVTLNLSNVEALQNHIMQVYNEANERNAKIIDSSNFMSQDENGETSLDLAKAETHELQIIPVYDPKDKLLKNVIFALTPKFDEVVKAPAGEQFLRKAYFSTIIKRIRDNVKSAVANGRNYVVPATVADFLNPQRQAGASEPFKKAVAELAKILVDKFDKKQPLAKSLLTQKNLLVALSNEAFTRQYLPFLLGKDTDAQGNRLSILDKWLEKTKADFESNGIATNEIDNLLTTRHQAAFIEEVESEEDSLEDLF